MYAVYILENLDEKIYIGSTQDIERRVITHNSDGHRWTSGKGPWKLIHSESYDARGQAMQREKYLKSLKAGQRIKKILHISDNNPG